MKQKALSRWLKTVMVGAGVCGVAVYALIVPEFGRSLIFDYPEFQGRYWPWLAFIWASGLPCFAALGLGWRIAGNIGADRSFSGENARYMKWIAWLAAGDAAFFFIGNLILAGLNMHHPGVFLLSLMVVFAGVAVTIAAAALSHLIQKAAALQAQSDLTI